jgi:hypothetical protein
MDTRWQLTDMIFNDALNYAPVKRDVFVIAACGPDEGLRSDIRSLLACASDNESYVQALVADIAGEMRAT